MQSYLFIDMQKPNKYIKFIGKFKDLKPMGYTFQRLYANDYNTWRKSVDPEGYGDTIWVWQKGKAVELNDLYGYSYLIMEEVIEKGRKGHRYPPSKIFPNEPDFGVFLLDKDTMKLLDFDLTSTILWQDVLSQRGERDEPTKEECDEYYRRYREVTVRDSFIAMIKELIDKKMIEVVEND